MFFYRELYDDGSDWEIVVEGDYYDGGSEDSAPPSPVFYSDDESYSRSQYDFADGSDSDARLDDRIRIRGDADLQHSDDEIEVGFLHRGGNVHPPTTNKTGPGGSQHPDFSGEVTRMSGGAGPRKNGRTVVVHPTIHPAKETEEEGKRAYPNHHRGSKPHPHYRRRKGSGKKYPPSGAVTTSTPRKATPTSKRTTTHLTTAFSADSATMSASCPKDLMLARPRSTSESPDSGTMGYFTPRHVDEEIDIIPPSTSEEEDDDGDSLNSPSGYRQQKRPQQPIRRQHRDFETPLLYVPPLSGSSSSLEFSTPATGSEIKKSSPEHSVKNKGRSEEVDSPLTSHTLGLSTTAGLIQTSRYMCMCSRNRNQGVLRRGSYRQP